MDYLGKVQREKIEKNQKLLLVLLHIHIGKFYPLRKWLGIDYKGKIENISGQSIGYNTIYSKDGEILTQTRCYQQPDLGYNLNILLDKLPQLALIIPVSLSPAYSFLWLMAFGLITTTYQPSTEDLHILANFPDTSYGNSDTIDICNTGPWIYRGLLYFDTSDIPSNALFLQGDLSLYFFNTSATTTMRINRMTRTTWTPAGTWNKYDGTNPWTTAGGDYTTTNAVSITDTTNNAWHTWNASTLIQDCFNNQTKKVYLLVDRTNTGADNKFWTHTYTGDTSLRPKLIVTYSLPVLGEFISEGAATTKLLLHLNGNSTDSSGNGNNGTDSNITYSLANGKFGQGAGFNGGSSEIVTGSWAVPLMGYTWSVWFKPGVNWNTSMTAAYTAIVGAYKDASNRDQLYYWKAGGGNLDFSISGISSENLFLYVSTYTAGTWYLATVTRSGNDFVLYINGRAVAAKTSAVISTTGNRVVYVGQEGAGSYMNGAVDEVLISNYAWSAAKIAKYYANCRGFYATL